MSHRIQIFLIIVLPNILTAEEPDYRNSGLMTNDGAGPNFKSPYEYYVFALNYANRIGVPAFDIVDTLIDCPKYLDYFLRGEEYEELFRQYFIALTPDETTELIVRVEKELFGRIDHVRMSITENYIHLSRRLRGYPCVRDYNDDTGEELFELEHDIVSSFDGFDERACDDYVNAGVEQANRERAAVGLGPLDDPVDVVYALVQEFSAPFNAVRDTRMPRYAEYVISLIEEDPRQDVILM
jgi:hypothetical protein